MNKKNIQVIGLFGILLLILTALFIPGTAIAGGQGKFLIVGTGPGAPDLISIRGAHSIKTADVVFARQQSAEVFTDYLQDKQVISLPLFRYWEILEKECWDPAPEHRESCQKLLAERKERAQMIRSFVNQGKKVVLLEGGDPCIFGSLRWIKQEFQDDEFEIIPGISSFNATNALLKREVADAYVAEKQTRSLIMTTPLRQEDRYDSIPQLAASQATMVFFMPQGFENNVIPELLKHYSPQTPVAVVRGASIEGRQRILRGTLEKFPAQPPEEQWNRIIYVGEFLNDACGKFE
ncbi:MAG: SAM-dependent methyltransferase [Desulfosudaceae bacterium]